MPVFSRVRPLLAPALHATASCKQAQALVLFATVDLDLLSLEGLDAAFGAATAAGAGADGGAAAGFDCESASPAPAAFI